MDYEAPKEASAGFSVYNFEGEDWKNKQKKEQKLAALDNWIQMPKRERKANPAYNIDSYFKDALSAGSKDKKEKVPRYRKTPQISSWQFFPPELTPILEKQMFYYYKQNNIEKKIVEFRDFEDPDIECAVVNESIRKAKPLTEDEIAERDELLQKGFIQWKKQDFYAFLRANEQFGRNDKKNILISMLDYSSKNGNKFDEGEIMDYYHAFWNDEKYKEIEDWERHLERIVKGEEKIQRKIDVREAIKTKVNSYGNPFFQMNINYSIAKVANRSWSESEDRYMITMLEKIGMDKPTVYEEIKRSIRIGRKLSRFGVRNLG